VDYLILALMDVDYCHVRRRRLLTRGVDRDERRSYRRWWRGTERRDRWDETRSPKAVGGQSFADLPQTPVPNGYSDLHARAVPAAG